MIAIPTLPDALVLWPEPCLYVVATPIGHLSDCSARAAAVLSQVGLLCAEDTRKTRQLLKGLGIACPGQRLLSLHGHNEASQVSTVLQALSEGVSVALVSDAGTPLVSDPGARLVAAVAAAGLRVSPVPGPSALTALLSVSGLMTAEDAAFQFLGFLPSKPGQRRERILQMAQTPMVSVCFEAPHRIEATLNDLVSLLGPEDQVCLGRELTKPFETLIRGHAQAVSEQWHAALARDPMAGHGEYVLAVSPRVQMPSAAIPAQSQLDFSAWAALLLDEMPKSNAARLLGKAFGVDRSVAYEALLRLTK